MKLNSMEQKEFSASIEHTIDAAATGTKLFFPGSFFKGRTASPRLARYLYEQVHHGFLQNTLRPLGTRSKHGYVKL